MFAPPVVYGNDWALGSSTSINSMPHIAHISLVVRDYDEALDFYCGKLGFTLVEDKPVPAQNKRWVTILPPGAWPYATTILLAKASSPAQHAAIGNQTGGRVFLFLETDDFQSDFNKLTRSGVEWVRPPTVEDYGTVAVFKDLYGNQWDLVERAKLPEDSGTLRKPGHPTLTLTKDYKAKKKSRRCCC